MGTCHVFSSPLLLCLPTHDHPLHSQVTCCASDLPPVNPTRSGAPGERPLLNSQILTLSQHESPSHFFFLSSLWISVSFRIQLLTVLEQAMYRLISCLKHLAMFLHPSMLHGFFLPSFPSRKLTEPTVVGAAPPYRPALWGRDEVLFPRPRGRYA